MNQPGLVDQQSSLIEGIEINTSKKNPTISNKKFASDLNSKFKNIKGSRETVR